jgi:hypothetical protein
MDPTVGLTRPFKNLKRKNHWGEATINYELLQKDNEYFDPRQNQKFDSGAVDTNITCDCCNELSTIQPVTTRKEGEENKIEEEEHGHSDNQKMRQLLSDKLLIIIGLHNYWPAEIF